MYANNLKQLINFIYFIIIGGILSIIFDVFRILRRAFKTSDIITNIEDAIFGIITGSIIIFSVFLLNNGELRLYIFIGISIGIITYMLFISRYFIKSSMIIISIIKKIIILVTKPFKICFKILKRIFFKPISFIVINIKSFLRKLFIKFKKCIKISKKTNNQEGF